MKSLQVELGQEALDNQVPQDLQEHQEHPVWE